MSEILWSASEIAAATGGRAFGDFAAQDIAIDSRRVKPGDLFVALKGPNFDGHDFVRQALAAGAVGALVHRRPLGLDEAAPLVMATDTLQALGDLARRARSRSAAKFIAVTGSVGKTGTKEALRNVFGRIAPTFASEGNLNNHWGAPLSLARLSPAASFGIFELGMNHAGEIAPLSRLVRPHLAIVTWVAAVHIEFFPSVAAIADAKAEIFLGLEPGGIAVLPRDNEHFVRLAAAAERCGAGRLITFGEHAESQARLIDCEIGEAGNVVTADILGRSLAFAMPVPGRHLARNAMAVLAAASALGLDLDRAASALATLPALAGRGRRESVRLPDGGTLTMIDEAYNASPASMRAALAVLGALKPMGQGRRIAVLGDMRELGERGPDLHRELAPDLIAAGIDRAYLVGPLMRGLYDSLPAVLRGHHSADSQGMVEPLAKDLRAGDLVLVKGSLGTRMAVLVESLRHLAADAAPVRRANGH